MTDRIDRRDVLRGIGAAGVLGLAGCVGDDDEAEAGEIDLGLLMGTTGVLQALGPPIRDGAEAVVEQINDGDTEWEVNTRFEETNTDPTEGVNGAQALVDADVSMILGALLSDVSLDVAEDVTLEEGVIQMSPASTAVEYSLLDEDLDGTFTWRTTPSDAFQGPVAAGIARDELGAESVSTVAVDDAYGRGLSGAFVDAFEADGGDVLAEELIEGGGDSFTAELQSALAPDPDMLYVVAFPAEGQDLFRDFYEEFDRPDMPVLVPDGLQEATLPADAGQDVATFANVTGTGPGISDDIASGLDAYFDQVGEGGDGVFVRESYDAAAVLCLARVAAGSNDPDDIREEIRTVTEGDGEEVTAANIVEGIELAADGDDIVYNGVSRPLSFDENGDVDTAVYEYFGWTTDEEGNAALETLDILTS